jgi:cysteine desulfurase
MSAAHERGSLAGAGAPALTYLDWNSTSPLSDDVIAAMVGAARDFWANPSSIHRLGQKSKHLVESVRRDIACLVGSSPRDIIFTSGGTESNNWALHDAQSLVLSRLEHPSVTRIGERFQEAGRPVKWVPVGSNGQVDLEGIERCLSEVPKGACLALMAVNHETGVIQPLQEAWQIAHSKGAWLHVDAVQAVGKLDPARWQWWDSISLGAHKIQGPKGIGALAWRCGAPTPRPGLVGGSQERGLRPGTVDPMLIAGFGAALRSAHDAPEAYRALAHLRDTLERALVGLAQPNIAIGTERAGHVASLFVPNWPGAELVAALDLEGVCISSGSACSAGTSEPSPVISAMLGESRARSTVRVSLGRATTAADIEHAIRAFEKVLTRT